MKAHKYWSIGAMVTMVGIFYTGYKGLKAAHKYFAFTDDIYDLEEFVKTITDMGIWLYSLEVGPMPITVFHAEDFGC